MNAIDSSIAIAAFGTWHRLHAAAADVVAAGCALPAHAMLETYSVLTAYPPPHRAPADLVSEWIDSRFATLLAPPSPTEHRDLVRLLGNAGRSGGSVYDGLIALTARRAGATLITADKRAMPVYALIGVDVRLLDGR